MKIKNILNLPGGTKLNMLIYKMNEKNRDNNNKEYHILRYPSKL